MQRAIPMIAVSGTILVHACHRADIARADKAGEGLLAGGGRKAVTQNQNKGDQPRQDVSGCPRFF